MVVLENIDAPTMEAVLDVSGIFNLGNVPPAPEEVLLNPPRNLCSSVKELETTV